MPTTAGSVNTARNTHGSEARRLSDPRVSAREMRPATPPTTGR